MKPFPTTLASSSSFMKPENVDKISAASLHELAEKGFAIQIGITESDISALQALSIQESIRKYCPKDCTERFKDKPTVEKWLTKKRLVFLLKESSSGKLAGIAWAGPGTSPYIPLGKITGGVRLSEHFQGLGLATPFLAVALEHTREKYTEELIWYECWESNAGALHVYQKLGFEIVDARRSSRPDPKGTTELDNRIYMQLVTHKGDQNVK